MTVVHVAQKGEVQNMFFIRGQKRKEGIKKKLIVIFLTSITAIASAACGVSDALAERMHAQVYNAADYNYTRNGYEEIAISNARFYVPEYCIDIDDYVLANYKTFLAQNDYYMIYASDVTGRRTIHDEDSGKMTENVEKYLKKFQEFSKINVADEHTRLKTQKETKTIYKNISCRMNGSRFQGELTVLAGEDFEIVMLVFCNNYFDNEKIETMIKSITSGESDEYYYYSDAYDDYYYRYFRKFYFPHNNFGDYYRAYNGKEPTLPKDYASYQIMIEDDVCTVPVSFQDFEAMGWEYQEDAQYVITPDTPMMTGSWVKNGVTVKTTVYNTTEEEIPVKEGTIGSIQVGDIQEKDAADVYVNLPAKIEMFKSSLSDIITTYGTADDDEYANTYYRVSYIFDQKIRVDLYVSRKSEVLEEVRLHYLWETTKEAESEAESP